MGGGGGGGGGIMVVENMDCEKIENIDYIFFSIFFSIIAAFTPNLIFFSLEIRSNVSHEPLVWTVEEVLRACLIIETSDHLWKRRHWSLY